MKKKPTYQPAFHELFLATEAEADAAIAVLAAFYPLDYYRARFIGGCTKGQVGYGFKFAVGRSGKDRF